MVDASHLTRELQLVKSPAEIAYIQEGVRIAEVGHQAIRDCAKEGMSELAVFGEVLRAMMAEGGELSALIPIFTLSPVRDGRMVAIGHSLPGRRQVEAGHHLERGSLRCGAPLSREHPSGALFR